MVDDGVQLESTGGSHGVRGQDLGDALVDQVIEQPGLTVVVTVAPSRIGPASDGGDPLRRGFDDVAEADLFRRPAQAIAVLAAGQTDQQTRGPERQGELLHAACRDP